MARPKLYKSSEENALKIFRVLKLNGPDYLSVSEIAKRTALHKWVVSRMIDLALSPVVDIVSPEELEQLGMKIKLVRLNNQNVTEDEVMRAVKLKAQLTEG